MLKNLFGDEFADDLIKFGAELSDIRTDYIVIFARKAYRLYDLLTTTGHCSLEKPVFSQRILEQDLSWANGKTITLIDDTLILGTTLAETKAQLLAAGAITVDVIVFCINEDWHDPRFITPNRYIRSLKNNEVIDFCQKEVRAFSKLAIPYIVDFPISLTEAFEAEKIVENEYWEAISISTFDQVQSGLVNTTMLPKNVFWEQLKETLGKQIWLLLDLVKIRIIGSKLENGEIRAKIVPIVTFKDMRVDILDTVFESTCEQYLGTDNLEEIKKKLSSNKAKLRFLQYVLALHLGYQFSLTYLHKRKLGFDEAETQRIFGPWLLEKLRPLHRNPRKRFSSPISLIEDIPPSKLSKSAPAGQEIVSRTKEILANLNIESNNLLTLFADLFATMYQHVEIPARNDARRLGPNKYHLSRFRDRLKFGIVWSEFAAIVAKSTEQPATRLTYNSMSIVLDFWNDRGVCVPTTVDYGGIVYRAFRHGELGKLSMREIQMLSVMLKEFNNSSQEESISQISLLKLSSILLRSAMKEGKIEVITGIDGVDENTFRLGYYIHGVVPFTPTKSIKNHTIDDSEEFLSYETDSAITTPDQAAWITRRMQKAGIIERSTNKGGQQYLIKSEYETDLLSDEDIDYAAELGEFIGTGIRNRVITYDDIVKSATYPDLISAVCAINAETDLISQNNQFSSTIQAIRNKSAFVISTKKKALRNSYAVLLKESRNKLHGWTFKEFKNTRDALLNDLVANAPTGKRTLRSKIDSYFSFFRIPIPLASEQLFKKFFVDQCAEIIEFHLHYYTLRLTLAIAEREYCDSNIDEELHKIMNSIENSCATLSRIDSKLNRFDNAFKSLLHRIDNIVGGRDDGSDLVTPEALNRLELDFDYLIDTMRQASIERENSILDYYESENPKGEVLNIIRFDVIDSGKLVNSDPSTFESFLNAIDKNIRRWNKEGQDRLFVCSPQIDTSDDEREIFFAKSLANVDVDQPISSNKHEPKITAQYFLMDLIKILQKPKFNKIRLRVLVIDTGLIPNENAWLKDKATIKGYSLMSKVSGLFDEFYKIQKSKYPSSTTLLVDSDYSAGPLHPKLKRNGLRNEERITIEISKSNLEATFRMLLGRL